MTRGPRVLSGEFNRCGKGPNAGGQLPTAATGALAVVAAESAKVRVDLA